MGLKESFVAKIKTVRGFLPVSSTEVAVNTEKLTEAQLRLAAKNKEKPVAAVIADNKLAGTPPSEQVEGYDTPSGIR